MVDEQRNNSGPDKTRTLANKEESFMADSKMANPEVNVPNFILLSSPANQHIPDKAALSKHTETYDGAIARDSAGKMTEGSCIQATAVAPALGKLPRETGYGDFSLECMSLAGESTLSKYLKGICDTWEERSNNVRVSDRSEFEDRHFRFTDLPIEVRERTLRTLLSPFFDEEGYLKLDIHGDWKFIRELTPVWSSSPKLNRSGLLSLYDPLGPHPTRPITYGLITNPLKMRKDKDSPKEKDWLMLRLVRNLSNVSCEFRQALGRIFWQNISLQALNGQQDELLGFLETRPAVCPNIKKLCCAIDYRNFRFCHTARNVFERMPSLLKLESLVLVLDLNESDVIDLVAGGEPLKYFGVVRSIHVTREFLLHLNVQSSLSKTIESLRSGNSRAESDRLEKLSIEIQPQVREALLPNSLRAKDLNFMTDEEKYLQTRKGLVEKI